MKSTNEMATEPAKYNTMLEYIMFTITFYPHILSRAFLVPRLYAQQMTYQFYPVA